MNQLATSPVELVFERPQQKFVIVNNIVLHIYYLPKKKIETLCRSITTTPVVCLFTCEYDCLIVLVRKVIDTHVCRL